MASSFRGSFKLQQLRGVIDQFSVQQPILTRATSSTVAVVAQNNVANMSQVLHPQQCAISLPAISARQQLFNDTRVFGANLGNANVSNSSLLNPAVLEARRFYDAKVVEHFQKPRNVGNLDKSKQSVGTAVVGKASCGDVIKMSIDVGEDGVIRDAKFKTFGCGSAIASSSLATEMVIGRSVSEAAQVRNTEIAQHLKLPPVKLHCSVLAEESIQAALKDWESKNPGRA